ncbi:MAG: hypothetical protein AAF939_19790, partial [Planctomycetota bacterium]
WLSRLKTSQVIDPGSLLFYRAITEHQLLKTSDCLETLEFLLENKESITVRYRVMAEYAMADLKNLETGSLDEISRRMSDIQRRTSLYRSGTQVLRQEERVLHQLDELIKQLENQQQQQSSSESTQPTNPMEDSQNAPGAGSGEVAGKSLSEGGDWGNLPPAQRESALAELSKDLPPHFRTVIEEYFRKLADDEGR